MEADYEVLSLLNSLQNGEWTPQEEDQQTTVREDNEHRNAGQDRDLMSNRKQPYHRGQATNPLQETTNEQQSDRYQNILDSWAAKMQGGLGDSEIATPGNVHNPHTHAHIHRVSYQSTSRRQHPSAKGSKITQKSRMQSNGKSFRHSKSFPATKDDEDVWFVVPGDLDVKLSE